MERKVQSGVTEADMRPFDLSLYKVEMSVRTEDAAV